MDGIFHLILDLASYLSSPFVRLLDLLYGSSCGYSKSYVADFFEEYSTTANCSDHRSDFEECSSSCKYCVSPNSGTYRSLSNVKEQLLVSTRREIKNRRSHGGISLVLKGSFTLSIRLTLQFCGLRIIWRIALASWSCFVYSIIRVKERIGSTIARVQKTLRGSSDDIGWVQLTPGLPPVKDGTARFLELLQDARDGKHKLPDSFVYLLIYQAFSVITAPFILLPPRDSSQRWALLALLLKFTVR